MQKNIKRVFPWLILLMILSGAVTWYVLDRKVSDTQQQAYDEMLKEAELNLNGKHYSVALNKYYNATEIIPHQLKAYTGIIDILLLKNKVDDALTIVRKATRGLSSNQRSNLYKSIGDVYYSQTEYEKAKEVYQEGLGLGVDNSSLELALGKSLLNMGRIDDAQSQIEKNQYSGDDAIEANLILSYIYSIKDVDKAKSQIGGMTPSDTWNHFYDEFDTILKSLDDDEKFNFAKLARIYINSGYPFLAIEYLEGKNIDISQYSEAVYSLARAYLETKQYDKAIEYLDSALSLGGLESEIFWAKARATYAKNDLEASITNYSRAVEYAGKEIPEELLKEYIKMLLSNNQNLKASEVIKLALISSEQAHIYLLGLQVSSNLSENAKIDYYMNQLTKLELTETEEKEYLYWKAKLEIDKGEVENANITLDKLLSLDKFNPKYYLLLSQVKVKETDVEGAKEALEKCIEYDLNNSSTEEAIELLSKIK